MCFCIKSAHFQEEQKSYRVWELLNRANAGNVRHFQSVAPLKNHVVNHDHESCPSCTWKVMGVVRKCWRMKKESSRVKFKCWLRSHLHTPAMPSHIQVFEGRPPVRFEMFPFLPLPVITTVRWFEAVQGPATTVLAWKMTGAPNMHFLISWAMKRAPREEHCGNESLRRDDLVSSFQSFSLQWAGSLGRSADMWWHDINDVFGIKDININNQYPWSTSQLRLSVVTSVLCYTCEHTLRGMSS